MTIKEYICQKCDTIFEDRVSDKFIKTIVKKCPNCGSSNVSLYGNKKSFAKKTNK
jgi:putative FmdB family regulatory protein